MQKEYGVLPVDQQRLIKIWYTVKGFAGLLRIVKRMLDSMNGQCILRKEQHSEEYRASKETAQRLSGRFHGYMLSEKYD